MSAAGARGEVSLYGLARYVVRRPALLVWCAFIALIPFYVVASGLPQPGDALVLVLVPVMLIGWNRRIDRGLMRTIRPLALFTVWTLIVNYTWAFLEWKWTSPKDYLLFPLYYLFNLSIFTCALIAYARFGEAFLRVTLYVVFTLVMLQVAVSFLGRADLFRNALFFNNANALGYYALLAASMIALLQRRLGFGRFKASVAITGCAYLALISGSRAGVFGIAILLVLLVFSNPRVIIIASLAAGGLVLLGGPVSQAIDNVEVRMNRQSHKSFAEERGYDRIWAYREYIVTGAGEGDVNRFRDTPNGPGEVHSSFPTVLFSYGIVGMILFGTFSWRVLQGATPRAWLMLLPTLAYSSAHNGLRFTMLWILLAIFVVVKRPAGPGMTVPVPNTT